MSVEGDIKAVELGGELVQDVTSVVLVNNTTKTIDKTVPDNRKWIILSIRAMNPDDVQRNITITKFKEAAKTNTIKRYNVAATAASSLLQWPSGPFTAAFARKSSAPFEVLVTGNTIEIVWVAGGASAGGTDADGLIVEYLEVPD